MALGYAGEAIHHALAAQDLSLLQTMLLEHAWTLLNHSERRLLGQGSGALPFVIADCPTASNFIAGQAGPESAPL